MFSFLLGFLGLGAAAASMASDGEDGPDRAPVEARSVPQPEAPHTPTNGEEEHAGHEEPTEQDDPEEHAGHEEPTQSGKPIILVLGQSNAQLLYGSGAVQGALADMGSDAEVLSVAWGGTSVARPDGSWNVTVGDGEDTPGFLYTDLLEKMADLKAGASDTYIAGAIWLQGEADANLANDYYAATKDLFTQMYAELGEDFNITMLGLSDYQALNEAGRAAVEDDMQQLAADMANVTYIDADTVIAENDLSQAEAMRDGLHYNKVFFDGVAAEFLAQPELISALSGEEQSSGSTDDPHHDHEMGHDTGGMVALPTSEAEIEAYVEAVRSSPEGHSHEHGSSKAAEHMAAMDLVPRDAATHIAIGHGDWDDPANWHNGEVPGADAQVLIPEGVHITYDHISDTRLFTVRVDGKLEFSAEVDSQMVVDTIVVSPSGALQIGTEANPVDPQVNVDIIFANNGPIDTDWDPMLLSRGMIAHGKVDIHGAVKDSHEKVVDDPMAGDTWIDLGGTPEGWVVGDTIIIAGSSYEGYASNWDPTAGYTPPQDEIRVITEINDGMIFFDQPLVFDHDTPREDLKVSVANYTRNVSFETENAESAEIYERGHVMFMHNDDVDVRYAEFHELGRTDKSEPAFGVDHFDSIEFDANVKGRYSFHFHRAGLEDQEDPAISIGNAVYGSPGWGFVHHESNAILENNATYDTFGAGYVAENGTETGAWIDNIAIFAQGHTWHHPKAGNDLSNFDLATTGDGFWFQGRMVTSIDNVAASVNNGFVYFHRGIPPEGELSKFDAETTDLPSLFQHYDNVGIDDHPILSFSGNEAFASKTGLYVLKGNSMQGHDVHSVLEDFTAWNVQLGADLSYTAHYTLKDFDLVAEDDTASWNLDSFGIMFGSNTSDMAIIDSSFEGFNRAIALTHTFTVPEVSPEENEFTIVNPSYTDVGTEIDGYDPALDTLIFREDLPNLTPDIKLDAPLTYNDNWQQEGGREIEISGTKTDSLGETDFPSGWDDFTIKMSPAISFLEEEGYYTTSDGQNYAMLDLFFSDRLTGDIYMERHPVFLDDGVQVGNQYSIYSDVPFNGIQDLGGEDDPTIDSAVLWATLTEGQVELSEEAIAMQEEEALADLL